MRTVIILKHPDGTSTAYDFLTTMVHFNPELNLNTSRKYIRLKGKYIKKTKDGDYVAIKTNVINHPEHKRGDIKNLKNKTK